MPCVSTLRAGQPQRGVPSTPWHTLQHYKKVQRRFPRLQPRQSAMAEHPSSKLLKPEDMPLPSHSPWLFRMAPIGRADLYFSVMTGFAECVVVTLVRTLLRSPSGTTRSRTA